jgi:hypothetical protein
MVHWWVLVHCDPVRCEKVLGFQHIFSAVQKWNFTKVSFLGKRNSHDLLNMTFHQAECIFFNFMLPGYFKVSAL